MIVHLLSLLFPISVVIAVVWGVFYIIGTLDGWQAKNKSTVK